MNRRALISQALRKKYKIRLLGLSTVSHAPTLENPCTITDVGTLSEGAYLISISFGGNNYYYANSAPLCSTYNPLVPYTDTSAESAYANIGARDYIEITQDSVMLYTHINRNTLPTVLNPDTANLNPTHFTGFLSSAHKNGNYISTHFKPIGDGNAAVPYSYNSNGIGDTGGSRIYLIMPKTGIGGTQSSTKEECAALYTTYMTAQISMLGAANCMYYTANQIPVTKDLTNTDFGQACMNIAKRCNGEGVTSNAVVEIEEAQDVL